jgi:large subunit ribosomal protein L19
LQNTVLHDKVLTYMAIAFTPVNIASRKAVEFSSGDTVRVWSKIEDKGKYRLQAFHGTDPQATFTVRKISNGVGVERIFPLFSPMIDKIELTKKAKTRRSKLYYIRDKAAKEIRRKMKRIIMGPAPIAALHGEAGAEVDAPESSEE